MLDILQKRLDETKDCYRSLKSQQGIDLSSNDYLGFSQDPLLKELFLEKIKQFPLGATGSRLLRGNLQLFEETETILAQFVNRETATLFPSGYQANLALMPAVLTANDVVFSDSENHASIIDGIRLSKAQKVIYPHLDYQFLETELQRQSHNKNLKVIVSESLFSMSGTIANLQKLVELAEQYNALLIIDEAHSTGLWGPSLVSTLNLANNVFATIHTGGKALGVGGAWIAGDDILKKLLINFARPFIFSTAPVPLLAILLQTVISHYQQVGSTRAHDLFQKITKFHFDFKNTSLDKNPRISLRSIRATPSKLFMEQISPIFPFIIGENSKALKISLNLQKLGWDVRAIRPPTVPSGAARLRITIKWTNSEAELNRFAQDLNNCYAQHQYE